MYTLLTGTLCDETQSYFVAFRSEFVVSRARLQAQPLSTYQKLHSYVGVRCCPLLPTTTCACQVPASRRTASRSYVAAQRACITVSRACPLSCVHAMLWLLRLRC